jgi:biopolymer transport protein ExbB
LKAFQNSTMLLDLFLLFQKTTNVVSDNIKNAGVVQEKSFFQLITSGGGVSNFILLCLFGMLVYAIYLFIERYLTITKIAEIDQGFMNSVRTNIKSGNIAAAKSLCQATNSPIAKMIEKGVARIGQPAEDIERAMESVGRVEIFNMEKGVGTLSLIAKLAPMFGFVGTILGVIKIFQKIAESNDLSITTISDGLNTKMFTSAAGLIVGITAFFGYHTLSSMVDKVVVNLEKIAIDFMDLLHEPS